MLRDRTVAPRARAPKPSEPLVPRVRRPRTRHARAPPSDGPCAEGGALPAEDLPHPLTRLRPAFVPLYSPSHTPRLGRRQHPHQPPAQRARTDRLKRTCHTYMPLVPSTCHARTPAPSLPRHDPDHAPTYPSDASYAMIARSPSSLSVAPSLSAPLGTARAIARPRRSAGQLRRV